MLRKFVAALIVITMLLPILTQVHAAEQAAMAMDEANAMQEYADMIDELITLSGEAARAGNHELAQQCDELLQSYGVEIITTNDINTAMAYFELEEPVDAVLPSAVPDLEDTNAIRWYKTEYVDYYHYLYGQYYDLVCVRAEPINAVASDLYISAVTVKNPNAKSYGEALLDNAAEAAAEAVISFALTELTGTSVLMTLADVLTSAKYDSEDHTTVKFNSEAMSVTWYAMVHVNFWYIKVHGSSYEHALVCTENKVTLGGAYSANVHFVEDDGSFDTDTIHEDMPDLVYKASQYGYLAKIAETYENSVFRVDSVGEVAVSFAGHTVTLYDFRSPYSPGDLL